MAKKCAYDVIYEWSHVAIALLGYRNPPSLSDKRSENINQFTNMTRSLLLASQHQKLSKHACAISSHINNQSWINQFVLIIFCFVFKGLQIWFSCKKNWPILLLAFQHQKLSKNACAISCSSHVNNQSWILNSESTNSFHHFFERAANWFFFVE